MSALDEVNTQRLVKQLEQELSKFVGKLRTTKDLSGLERIYHSYIDRLHPTEVGEPQVITFWSMSETNALQFYDAQENEVKWPVPRIKSRRLLRVWAKKQVGKALVGVTFIPVLPLDSIVLKHKVIRDEPTLT